MREIAGHYAAANATMVTWCMGLTHHPEAVATIQQVVNLLLLRGNIGRRGAGAMPVRGHSNVQGDRTMGATSTVTTTWLDNLEATFPGARLCRDAGRDAAGVIEGLFDGSVQALLSLGGNFGVASPDSPRVLAALERCRFTLHIATKLNRTHCHPGDVSLLLPTLGRTDRDLRPGGEQCISTEDSSSTVRASHGIQAPISEQQRSEPAIVAQLAQALGCAPTVPWPGFADDYAAIRDRIEQCQRGVTAGFERYNDKLERDGRFALPNSAAQRDWHTASGKARFIAHALRDDSPVQQARQRHGDAVLTLMTIRAHDQFNTTVYSSDDRYRDVAGDRHVVFLNADDLAARGLADGDRIDIETLVDDGHDRRVSAWTARACGHRARLLRRVLPGGQRPDRRQRVLRRHAHAAVQGDAGARRRARAGGCAVTDGRLVRHRRFVGRQQVKSTSFRRLDYRVCVTSPPCPRRNSAARSRCSIENACTSTVVWPSAIASRVAST